MKNTIIAQYTNGNYTVQILSDGTKIRITDNKEFIGTFPESIDCKITNYCDMGCLYCHEKSNTLGHHADLNVLLEIIKDLPAGVELAIGGGNPLSHPNLTTFLYTLTSKGIIANITINQGHLIRYKDLIADLIENKLVYGIGISITNSNLDAIIPIMKLSSNVVFHIIAGINNINIIDELCKLDYCKILILGYKTFGLGIKKKKKKVDENLAVWKAKLRSYITKCTISFDNLAIEQLDVKSILTKESWDKFYMGDDFCYTMYIDAVNQHYAPTSRDDKRTSFSSMGLLEYFDSRNLYTCTDTE